MSIKIFCGPLFHFIHSPASLHDHSCYEYIENGMLVVDEGKIVAAGSKEQLYSTYASLSDSMIDYSSYLMMPGWIDSHIHYPQAEIIASYGRHLLEWLNEYVFPAEKKYAVKEYARPMASFFLNELLRQGTTTAAIYSTVHSPSVEAIFECAEELNMRIISGKTLMDCNAPDYLTDTPETAYRESKQLIEQWHGRGRLQYAITPRFAPTSTEEELQITSQLLQEHPTVYLQTHLSENKNEVAWVKQLFPWSRDYTDVYDHFHLLGPRSIFGHAIYLSEREWKRLHDTQSVVAWCPISNLFLGSGLFRLDEARKHLNRLSIGTDVGAGSSFSLLHTLSDAYKTAALQSITFSALEGFYAITLGNARALSLDHYIGNLQPGKEADFLVIDFNSTPLLCEKMKRATSLEEKLFNLMMLGDDRSIHATYIGGEMTP